MSSNVIEDLAHVLGKTGLGLNGMVHCDLTVDEHQCALECGQYMFKTNRPTVYAARECFTIAKFSFHFVW